MLPAAYLLFDLNEVEADCFEWSLDETVRWICPSSNFGIRMFFDKGLLT